MAEKKYPSVTLTRKEKTRVKTAKRRKTSSTRWLQRQLNDPYVAEAKRLGYRSRAAFKLLQLDAQFKFLKPGRRVVDLGAAPGGWSQMAVKLTHSPKAAPHVIGVDLLPIEPMPGALFLEGDFREEAIRAQILELLGGQVDVVMSDMAAGTIGHAKTDHMRIMYLVEIAFEFAKKTLREGGIFIAKIFQGGAEQALLSQIKQHFASVRHYKPEASRKDSSETYIVATHFKAVAEQKVKLKGKRENQTQAKGKAE